MSISTAFTLYILPFGIARGVSNTTKALKFLNGNIDSRKRTMNKKRKSVNNNDNASPNKVAKVKSPKVKKIKANQDTSLQQENKSATNIHQNVQKMSKKQKKKLKTAGENSTIENKATVTKEVNTKNTATKKDTETKKFSIFVANLNHMTKKIDLVNFFKDCGSVKSVALLRDFATRRSKNCAFVNFENEESIKLALEKNGVEFQERTIQVTLPSSSNKNKVTKTKLNKKTKTMRQTKQLKKKKNGIKQLGTA